MEHAQKVWQNVAGIPEIAKLLGSYQLEGGISSLLKVIQRSSIRLRRAMFVT